MLLGRSVNLILPANLYIYDPKKRNTLVTACQDVDGFSDFYRRLEQKISLAGRSKDTLNNYGLHLAKIALFFNRPPIEIETDQINEYLYHLQQTSELPSASFFKFAVYSLRFAYRMEGMRDNYISLPSIKAEKKLPVVLSRQEIKRMIAAPRLLKHRVLLGLLYGCGLRCFETRNLKLPDIDFDRKMLHVHRGKGRKDRYVPLSAILIEWMREYIESDKPEKWLFNGKKKCGDRKTHYSPRGLGWVVRKASKQAGIIKRVSTHTLRHTYATHLLEDGLDIVSIKDLLGHSSIETTMVYLHVAHYDRVKSFSPLDTLYGIRQARLSFHEQPNPITPCSIANHMLDCEHCQQAR